MNAKDKTKVEVAVQLAERWVIAALRKHFFSLDEVKAAVKTLVAKLNAKVMRHVKKSRHWQLFEELAPRGEPRNRPLRAGARPPRLGTARSAAPGLVTRPVPRARRLSARTRSA